MELSSIPWHDPGKSKGKRLDAGTLYAIGAGAAAAGSVGKAAVAGGVAGGVAGAVAGGLVGGFLGEQYSVCRLIISSNNLKNKSEYASVAFDATEEKLLKGDFLGYIKKAEFIAWLSNSNEIPTGFLKTAIKYDNDYFPDDHFRQAIVNVLGAHDKRPVELILPFLNDKSHKVQLQAVESLGRTRDHRAIEGLISALKKNNTCEGPANDFNTGSHELCKMIVASLKEISGSDIHSPNQWIDWWDNNKQRNDKSDKYKSNEPQKPYFNHLKLRLCSLAND